MRPKTCSHEVKKEANETDSIHDHRGAISTYNCVLRILKQSTKNTVRAKNQRWYQMMTEDLQLELIQSEK